MHACTYESVRNAHTYIAKLGLLKHCKSPSFFDKTVHIYCTVLRVARLLRVAGQDGKMAPSDKRAAEQVCILSSIPRTHTETEKEVTPKSCPLTSHAMTHMLSHTLVYMTIINERLTITKARR